MHLASYRLAHEFTGGVISLSVLMGKGQQVLASKLNPNVSTHHLTIAELEMLGDFTNRNIDLAEFFATKASAIVLPLPEIVDGDMGLLDDWLNITQEFGKAGAAFQKAYADGDVTARERDAINRQCDQMIGAVMQFKASVKRVAADE